MTTTGDHRLVARPQLRKPRDWEATVESWALVTVSWVGGEAIRERTPLCS